MGWDPWGDAKKKVDEATNTSVPGIPGMPGSQSSTIGQEWDDFTHPFSNGNQNRTWQDILGGGAGPRADYLGMGNNITNPKKPDLQTPGHVPTQGEANQTSLGEELGNEKRMYSTWNILTGGEGVLDTPQTAGPTLLGS